LYIYFHFVVVRTINFHRCIELNTVAIDFDSLKWILIAIIMFIKNDLDISVTFVVCFNESYKFIIFVNVVTTSPS